VSQDTETNEAWRTIAASDTSLTGGRRSAEYMCDKMLYNGGNHYSIDDDGDGYYMDSQLMEPWNSVRKEK
jgi:hypothetical protein